jgi:hypothetical protein
MYSKEELNEAEQVRVYEEGYRYMLKEYLTNMNFYLILSLGRGLDYLPPNPNL